MGKTWVGISLGKSSFSPRRAMDACRRLFLFLWGVPAQLPVCKIPGSLFGDAGQGSMQMAGKEKGVPRGQGDRQRKGDRQGKAAHAFPERDSPGSGFAGVGGRVESCGWRNWVRASGGDGFSAAGLSPLVFFPELAGLELPLFGITALTTE